MTKPYVYEIEHIETGKKYIGCRYAEGCDPEELLKIDGYCTSSNIIKKIIDDEGLESFIINFIIPCENKSDVIVLETSKLDLVDAANNAMYFNMHNNHNLIIRREKLCELHGVEHISQIPEISEKISESKIQYYIDNPDFNKGENNPMFGVHRYGENAPNYGKKFTKEHKESISSSLKNYFEENPNVRKKENHPMWGMHHSEPHKKRISDALTGENNPMYGKVRSEETKYKISKSSKNRERAICPHCGKECDISNAKRWHFDNCKSIKDKE
jgi:hypothetical protein